MHWMPKVAHVQMMVMMMISDVQTNEANYALDAQGCPVQSISRQGVKTCETFGERKMPSKVFARRVFAYLRQQRGYCAYLQICF